MQKARQCAHGHAKSIKEYPAPVCTGAVVSFTPPCSESQGAHLRLSPWKHLEWVTGEQEARAALVGVSALFEGGQQGSVDLT